MSQWANFKLEEFDCKYSGENKVEHELIDKLQLVRDELGFPLIVSSGYRSADHPVEKSKSKPGTHNQGIAVDIAISHEKAYKLIASAIKHGFTGIGVKQKGSGRFIHLDISEGDESRPRPHIWSY